MKTIKTISLILTLLIFASCEKKKYPDTVIENEPEFYTAFSINNIPFSFQAGLNDYKVYSSYEQKTDSVYRFISEIRSISCTNNCPNSLKIEFSDSKFTAPGAGVDIDAAIHAGKYVYQSPELQVQFNSQYNKTAASYYWKFGDGNESQLANPIHTYKKGGIYNVSLSITSVNGCVSAINNKVKIGLPQGACISSIAANLGASNSVAFSQSTVGKEPLTYRWNFGDGQSSSHPNPTNNYAITGSYPVKLQVTDGDQNITEVNYNVVTSGDQSSCGANFSNNSPLSLNNSVSFSNVTVTYVDPAGIVYSSNQYIQDSGSNFEILSVSDFENNERGEATKKLQVKFNCIVYNGSKSIRIDGAEAVICIAYKK